MDPEKGESGREETKAFGEPAGLPGPNSKFSLGNPAGAVSHPGLWRLVCLLVQTFFFVLLEKLDP